MTDRFLFWQQPTIFLREKILLDIVKNIMFETPWLWSSILLKKTQLLDMLRKPSFPLKVSDDIVDIELAIL